MTIVQIVNVYLTNVTPKIVYFHYLEKTLLDQSVKKIFNLILKTEALLWSCERGFSAWADQLLSICVLFIYVMCLFVEIKVYLL